MRMFNLIISGYLIKNDDDIYHYAKCIDTVFDTTIIENLPKNNRFVGNTNSIDIYYDFDADYYFFITDTDKESDK